MTEHGYEIVGDDYTDTAEVPKDHDLWYRCKACGGMIPSVPKCNGGCACGNVFIDKDYWRLVVGEMRQLEVVRESKRRDAKKGRGKGV